MDCQTYFFKSAVWCPNNPDCPLIHYRCVHLDKPEKLAAWFEQLFESNGWPRAWRYTIYDYAHYHSNTHEVVAVFQGRGVIRFGDSAGRSVECNPGDAVLIPAGVSHQRLESTEDFQAVGAYPRGFKPDEIRPSDPLEEAHSAIAQVPKPEADPIRGDGKFPPGG